MEIPYELWIYGWQIYYQIPDFPVQNMAEPSVSSHKVAAQHKVAAHRQTTQLCAADQLLD